MKQDGARKQHAVAICPGPNLAFFSRVHSLEEMVGHIYGRVQGLVAHDRPNMFVNELRLNIDYFKKRSRSAWSHCRRAIRAISKNSERISRMRLTTIGH